MLPGNAATLMLRYGRCLMLLPIMPLLRHGAVDKAPPLYADDIYFLSPYFRRYHTLRDMLLYMPFTRLRRLALVTLMLMIRTATPRRACHIAV